MAKYEKSFFLSRELTGEDPYRASHSIELPPGLTHSLAYRTFERGEGSAFRGFLLAPFPTGERKPRSLPKAVANEVARLVNGYRKGHDNENIAFNVWLIGKGEERLTWSLERKGSRGSVRFDPVKLDPRLKVARDQGQHVVVKSELDTMQIRQWYRDLHYCLYLTAFQDRNRVADWEQRNHPPANQPAPTSRPISRIPMGVGHLETMWFERNGWQQLPDEVVNNLSEDAKKLLFPKQSWFRAVKRASGGLLLSLIATGFYELGKQDPDGRPANHVWTTYRAGICVDFAEARV